MYSPRRWSATLRTEKSFGDKRMFHYFREESIRNIAKQYGWDLITPQNMADKFMKFIETMGYELLL